MHFFLTLRRSRLLFLTDRFQKVQMFSSKDRHKMDRRRSTQPSPSRLVDRRARDINIPFRIYRIFPFIDFRRILRLRTLSFKGMYSSNFLTKVTRQQITRVIYRADYQGSKSCFNSVNILRFQVLLWGRNYNLVSREATRTQCFRAINRAIICRSASQGEGRLHLILRPPREDQRG